MKKTKLFACLLFISMALLSCGDDEVPPQQATGCKLAFFTNEVIANMTYQNDKLAKITFVGEGYVTFEYNSAGKVIKANSYLDDNTLDAYSTFNHVSSTLITFKNYEENQSGVFVETIANGRFEFDALGNLTKVQDDNSYTRYVYNAQNNPTASYLKKGNVPEYKDREFLNYDDKKNIVRENFLFIALEIDLDVYGVNNPKKIISFDTDGTVDETIDISYLYNEQGYVTKAFDSNVPSDGEIIYKYNCQ